MSFGVSINFDGNCREAVAYYAQVFGREQPAIRTYREGDTSLDPNVCMSDAGLDRVMYTCLDIEGTVVEFSDMPDNFQFQRGNSFMLAVTLENPRRAAHIFELLAEGGQVFVPFGEIPQGGC